MIEHSKYTDCLSISDTPFLRLLARFCPKIHPFIGEVGLRQKDVVAYMGLNTANSQLLFRCLLTEFSRIFLRDIPVSLLEEAHILQLCDCLVGQCIRSLCCQSVVC